MLKIQRQIKSLMEKNAAVDRIAFERIKIQKKMKINHRERILIVENSFLIKNHHIKIHCEPENTFAIMRSINIPHKTKIIQMIRFKF